MLFRSRGFDGSSKMDELCEEDEEVEVEAIEMEVFSTCCSNKRERESLKELRIKMVCWYS